MSSTRAPAARWLASAGASSPIVAEMNRAQNHLANAQHTPERY